MIVTYSPAGQESKTWTFDPADVPESAAEVIERRFGGDSPTYESWLNAVQQGGGRARRVLLWYLLWRDHPSLRFEQVDPRRSELKVELTRSELTEVIANVERNKRLDPDRKERALTAFYAALEDAPDDDQGKAQSPSDEPGTG